MEMYQYRYDSVVESGLEGAFFQFENSIIPDSYGSSNVSSIFDHRSSTVFEDLPHLDLSPLHYCISPYQANQSSNSTSTRSQQDTAIHHVSRSTEHTKQPTIDCREGARNDTRGHEWPAGHCGSIQCRERAVQCSPCELANHHGTQTRQYRQG